MTDYCRRRWRPWAALLGLALSLHLISMTHAFAGPTEKSPAAVSNPTTAVEPTDAKVLQETSADRMRTFTLALIKMLLSLLLVCVLAFVTLRWLVPKLSGLRRSTGGFLQVVDRFVLEPRKNLYLVRAGEDFHVIGVTDQQVSYLFSVPSEAAKEFFREAKPLGDLKVAKSFQEILQDLKQGKGGKA